MGTSVRFGYDNIVPNASLSADPTPETSLSSLKSDLESRRTLWPITDSSGVITIFGTFDDPVYASFMAIPDAYRVGDVEVRIDLYFEGGPDLLGMDWTEFTKNSPADYIGLPFWSAGVNEFGERFENTTLLPRTFVYWFGQPIEFQIFRLQIRKAASSDVLLSNVDMRHLFIGNYYEMQSSMTMPHDITYMTDPNLRQVSSGKWVSLTQQQQSRTMTVPLPYSTDQDKNSLWDLERRLDNKPFIISAFPEDADPRYFNHYTLMGYFADAINHRTEFVSVHDINLTVLEA